MHVRRLVKAGQTSHTVSLPKQWLIKNNLKKGDIVYINESGPAELTLTPEFSSKKGPTNDKTINIDGKDIGTIRREITSAYINNSSTITIIGKDLNQNTKDIRSRSDFITISIRFTWGS